MDRTNPGVRTVGSTRENGRSAAVIGDQSLLIQCVDMLRERGIDVVVVATDSAEITDWGITADVPIVANDRSLVQSLAEHRFDYLFSLTNLKIIPDEVLAMAGSLAVNFHDGPLPAYAGLYATSWALINRELEHGVSWHVMESGVDEGDLLGQARFELAPDETAYTLNVKCYENAITSFGELVDELIDPTGDGPARRVQDLDGRSYFGRFRRPEAAATVDWSQPVEQIDALHRALDFGQYENPLARTKLLVGDRVFLVESLSIGSSAGEVEGTPGDPGTIAAIEDRAVVVAATGGTVRVERLIDAAQATVDAASVVTGAGLSVGDRLPLVGSERAERLSQRNEELSRHETAWVAELDRLERVELPYPRSVGGPSTDALETAPIRLPDSVVADLDARFGPAVPGASPARARYLGAAFACYLARLTGTDEFHLDYRGPGLDLEDDLRPWFAPRVPLACRIDLTASSSDTISAMVDSIERTDGRGTFAVDVGVRFPQLAPRNLGWNKLPLSVGLEIGDATTSGAVDAGIDLVLAISDSGLSWRRNAAAYPADVYAQVEKQFLSFLEQLANPAAGADSTEGGPTTLAELSLLTPEERQLVLAEWNDTAKPVELDTTLHALFKACANARPDQTAVVFDGYGPDGTTLTYAELDERSDRMAAELRALGAGPERYVGVFMHRGADMIVGLLAILKSGAAYVPLDPTYPRDRIGFMIADADLAVVLTQAALAGEVPDWTGPILAVDGARTDAPALPETPAGGGSEIAYLIYTSGSTGTPKGVMVTHANAVNFLAGMDDHIDLADGDTWLTVTSLSFDISVLEIFWSLTRGLTLVVYADEYATDEAVEGSTTGAVAAGAPGDRIDDSDGPVRDISFSLFYFASDESEAGAGDKYELLMEGAKFADANGFEAVWTPERHFYAFGGLYPNPAITSAAIAAVTENVHIRAGSCVLPLHHPIRVAEEWSVVDNLSKGRTGIAFAAGWQPVDFVLRPENFADRKGAMIRDVDIVQRLWRGETIEMEGPNGPTEVRTLPRPVQEELPTWLTVAGNPETFAAAGAGGHNVLTHLLGQSVDEVAEKIRIYREARREAGHEGEGRITIMLHTLVGDDVEQVRDLVREPMKEYLRSSVQLIKEAAWSFPTFQQKAEVAGTSPLDVFENEDLSDDEMEALLEHAFNRYFEGSALFGTPESCQAMVEQLRRVGVDEIACQVDFGVPTPEVLRRLPQLDQVRAAAAERAALARRSPADPAPVVEPAPALGATGDSGPSPALDRSIPALIERHSVTHFQCTPSMGSMLIADDRFRTAAARLKMCLMGGEAFPQTLAKEITDIVSNGTVSDGTVLNVYGPTETTIWSSCFKVLNGDKPVSIGTPLANQQMYVVDRNLQPTPIGVPGELLIGGDGVTDAYLERPELNAERFVPDHFRPGHTDLAGRQARLYRTGDLVRYETDGSIEFLGRMDFQVKVRGYRIELGEIEARLNEHETVREAVVVAREDTPGDQRLVAYAIPRPGADVDGEQLKVHLGATLPDFMVPSHFVSLRSFPLTPNKKTDRKALPAPDKQGKSSGADYIAPEAGVQADLVELWQQLLGMSRVGVNDNFFDLGGHSLLAVQLHRRIRDELSVELSITDVFRFPTIASLTSHLDNQGKAAEEAGARATGRANSRRQAMAARRNRRRR